MGQPGGAANSVAVQCSMRRPELILDAIQADRVEH